MSHHDKPSYVEISRDNYFAYYVDSDNYCDLTLDDETGDKTLTMQLTDEFAKIAQGYEDGFNVVVSTLTYTCKGEKTSKQIVVEISKME